MTTTISKRLATGALAIAGSVAAFGFATTSPAQATVTTACNLDGFSVSDFSLLGSHGCFLDDKKFVYLGSDPTSATFNDNLLISQPVSELHSFNYQPIPALNSTIPTITIDYTIEVFNDPATSEDETLEKFFHQFSIGYDATGMGDLGITASKTVWLDGINGSQLVGNSTAQSIDIGGSGSAGNIVTVSGHQTKLFVRDVFGTTNPVGFINSVTNDFTQKRKIDVPEPSAILGILAVAGIGAFARRKS